MVSLLTKRRDAVFRALADPTRREILCLLRAGRKTVGEIAQDFPVSRPAISKHLRALRSARLITTRREGRTCFCSLNSEPLRAVDDWLRDYRAFWSASLRELKHHVEKSR